MGPCKQVWLFDNRGTIATCINLFTVQHVLQLLILQLLSNSCCMVVTVSHSRCHFLWCVKVATVHIKQHHAASPLKIPAVCGVVQLGKMFESGRLLATVVYLGSIAATLAVAFTVSPKRHL